MRLTRRNFFAAGGAAALCGCVGCETGPGRAADARRPTAAYARGRVTLISPLVRDPVRFFLVGDTHMTVNDERGNDYLKYTRRFDVNILARPRPNPPVEVLPPPDYAR